MKYDAIVLGSGQGGGPLAYALADLGWSVALVEKDKLGGTCINTGCTPTKTMVHRAQVTHHDYQILFANLVHGKNLTTDGRIVPFGRVP